MSQAKDGDSTRQKSPPENPGGKSDVYHDIANHLSLLASFVRLRAASLAKTGEALSPPDARFLLEEIAARIHVISRIHHSVSGDPHRRVSLEDCLREICAAFASALPFRKAVTLDYDGTEKCTVMVQQAIPIAMVVSEILSNSIRHADPEAKGVKIHLLCKGQKNGGAVIELSDNGVGLPAGFDIDSGGGTGFRIMRSLVKQLRATLEVVEQKPGLCVRLVLPGDGAPQAV